jgi:dihydroflavonol-4-reductase
VATHSNAAANITLVTGATGFIGRHCVSVLRQSGARLRLLCRNVDKARWLFGPDAEVVQGDLLNAASLKSACAGVSEIYNLAGSYEFGPAHRRVMWQTNVDGTENLLNAAAQAKAKRVVHCSTAGILAATGRMIGANDFPKRPPAFCHYKRSKWHGETRALAWCKRGLPVVIASPTAPVGEGDERPTPTGRMFLDLLRGRFPACTRTGLNIISVRDLAAGIVAAGQNGTPGERYLLGGENIWLQDLMALAAQAGNCPAPRFKVPWLVVALGGIFGEAFGRVGSGRGRLCWETAYFARQSQFFDIQPTSDALGWKPVVTTKAAVTEAVRYFAALLVADAAAKAATLCSPLRP